MNRFALVVAALLLSACPGSQTEIWSVDADLTLSDVEVTEGVQTDVVFDFVVESVPYVDTDSEYWPELHLSATSTLEATLQVLDADEQLLFDMATPGRVPMTTCVEDTRRCEGSFQLRILPSESGSTDIALEASVFQVGGEIDDEEYGSLTLTERTD